MTVRQCGNTKCKSRHKNAVYRVDENYMCHHCFERWLDSHFCDQHRVMRLSDNDGDFERTNFQKKHAMA